MHKLTEYLERFDSFVIYRHQYPDMDALGSQFGLAQYIRDTYPEKEVYCVGKGTQLSEQMGLVFDGPEEAVLKRSLAIILDTGNRARVDGPDPDRCAAVIRIDHHIKVETIGEWEWIDEKASATCEILALYLKESGSACSRAAAQYLYQGLVADNIRFTTNAVRKESFIAAAYLMGSGIDLEQCERLNFAGSWEDYQYETCVRSKVKRKENFLYAVMEQEDYLPIVHSFSSAKEKVYVLSGVEGIAVWALFTRMDDGVHYSASLRSKGADVRSVAAAYNGGGHICAAGIKNLTSRQVSVIIDQLSTISTE